MLTEKSDLPTIKNAIRKRIDGLNPVDTPDQEKISVQDIFWNDKYPGEFRARIVVDIGAVPWCLPNELPMDFAPNHYKVRRDMSHADLLNLIDRMAEDVKCVAALQKTQKIITGEDAPMSQGELNARVERSAAKNPLGVIV